MLQFQRALFVVLICLAPMLSLANPADDQIHEMIKQWRKRSGVDEKTESERLVGYSFAKTGDGSEIEVVDRATPLDTYTYKFKCTDSTFASCQVIGRDSRCFYSPGTGSYGEDEFVQARMQLQAMVESATGRAVNVESVKMWQSQGVIYTKLGWSYGTAGMMPNIETANFACVRKQTKIVCTDAASSGPNEP